MKPGQAVPWHVWSVRCMYASYACTASVVSWQQREMTLSVDDVVSRAITSSCALNTALGSRKTLWEASRHRWTLIRAGRPRVKHAQLLRQPSIDQCALRASDSDSSCLPRDRAVLPRFDLVASNPHLEVAQRRSGRASRPPLHSHTPGSDKRASNRICCFTRFCQTKKYKIQRTVQRITQDA